MIDVPVGGIGRNGAVFEKELDALEMTLRGGQVQRCPVIVIRLRHVDAGQFVAPHRGHVARRRREQQTHNVEALRLVLVTARVSLVLGVLQIVVPVEVEVAHELLCCIEKKKQR